VSTSTTTGLSGVICGNGSNILLCTTAVQTGQANTYGAFLQDFSAASVKLPSGFLSGDCTWTALGVITCTETNGTPFTGYATATYVADTTVTIGASVAFSANACSSATGTAGTASTVSMAGLLTTMTATFTPASDVHAVTGWSPASGGQLYFTSWPSSSGTLSYFVCNGTGSTITTGGSVTWNVSAR
jgi:hypothetical protein